MGVPFVAAIPLDPGVVEASDSGVPFVRWFTASETANAFSSVARVLLELDGDAHSVAG